MVPDGNTHGGNEKPPTQELGQPTPGGFVVSHALVSRNPVFMLAGGSIISSLARMREYCQQILASGQGLNSEFSLEMQSENRISQILPETGMDTQDLGGFGHSGMDEMATGGVGTSLNPRDTPPRCQ